MRFLRLCSMGLFGLGCGGDQFVAMTDDAGNKPPIDSSVADSILPANDSGFADVIGPKQDGGTVLPFCTGQNPTAIFCADWDKNPAQVADAYLGGSPSQITTTTQYTGQLAISTTTSVSPQNSLRPFFTASNGSTDALVLSDNFSSSLQVVHLSLSFRLGASIANNTIELGAIVVHFSKNADDFPIVIRESGGTVSAESPQLFGNGSCTMGTITNLGNWHRAEVWLNLNTSKVGCRVDQMASQSATGGFAFPSSTLMRFGIQVGLLSVAPGINGELNIDNVLLDANAPN